MIYEVREYINIMLKTRYTQVLMSRDDASLIQHLNI